MNPVRPQDAAHEAEGFEDCGIHFRSSPRASEQVACGYSHRFANAYKPGELFFAVKGERLDGHDYVNSALEKGAVAAVVSKDEMHRYSSHGAIAPGGGYADCAAESGGRGAPTVGKTADRHHRFSREDDHQGSDRARAGVALQSV